MGQVVTVSPLAHTPSPQYGPSTVWYWHDVVQVVQVNGGLWYAGVAQDVFVLSAPSSHCSVPSRTPLPQPEQSRGHVVLVSPLLQRPSPQYGPSTVLSVQLVVHVAQVSGGL